MRKLGIAGEGKETEVEEEKGKGVKGEKNVEIEGRR